MAASLFGVGVTNFDKINVQQDNNGAAATPAITFGDTDSGLFASADAQVQIATAGTQRLLVDATGITVVGSVVIGSASMAEADLEKIDGITDGTSAASKALVLDANSELNSVGVIKTQDTLVSSAQVLALNATPITVVSAGGAGVFRQFLYALVFLDYNSAAYVADAGEDLVFQNLSGGDLISQTLDGSLFTGTADKLAVAYPRNADAAATNDLVDNGGVEVTIQSGEWLTGDSPLKIRVVYREIRLADLEAIA